MTLHKNQVQKCDFLLMCAPHLCKKSATRRLRCRIDKHLYLNRYLEEVGVSNRCRFYTPAQVRMIITELEEP